MIANRKVLAVFIAALALMMVAPIAALAQDENTEPVLVTVEVEGLAPLTLASLDFVNPFEHKFRMRAIAGLDTDRTDVNHTVDQ